MWDECEFHQVAHFDLQDAVLVFWEMDGIDLLFE